MSIITENSPAKAKEVFGTVELMEHILLKLNALDVLRAMQALRSMYDTVLGSTKIQKQIGLIPDSASHLHLPIMPPQPTAPFPLPQVGQHFHGLYLSEVSEPLETLSDDERDAFELPSELINPVVFELQFDFSDVFLQRLGSRVRDILICQPPLKMMNVKLHCWHCSESTKVSKQHAGAIRTRNGRFITIGSVQRAGVRARRSHRKKCKDPEASSTAIVYFQGIKGSVRDDDPFMHRTRDTMRWQLNLEKKWSR